MNEFAAFFAHIDPPLLVVTTTDGVERAGCLVGFATQCSIHPPRLLVCVSVVNHTAAVLERANVLAVHVLGASQVGVASVFGEATGDETDKFQHVATRTARTGAPLLEQCSAWMEAAIVAKFPLGDHVGHLLHVVASGRGNELGVLRQSAVAWFEPGHPADEVLHRPRRERA